MKKWRLFLRSRIVRRTQSSLDFLLVQFHFTTSQKYINIDISELSSLANGLLKDIQSVENSLCSDLSNEFVEGTNSKLKMIKRTMYGRCIQELLAAKLMVARNG